MQNKKTDIIMSKLPKVFAVILTTFKVFLAITPTDVIIGSKTG